MTARTVTLPGKATRKSMHPILVSLLCVGAGAVCFVVSFGLSFDLYGESGIEALTGFLMLDLVVGLAAGIASGPVRRRAVGNALLLAAGIFSSFALPATVLAIVRFGQRRTLPVDAAIVSLAALGSTGMSLWQDTVVGITPENPLLIAAGSAALTIGLLLWARMRATRAALIDALRKQAESTEQARAALEKSYEAELASARARERSALARDMHDGISHKLAIVSMHAGALASRDDLSPQQVRDASHTIRNAAAEAGELLREVLIALRSPDAGPQACPLPTTESIEALIAAAQARGSRVSLIWRNLTPSELRAGSAQAVALARIVEESLMNAAKYAPGEFLDIRIAREGNVLVLNASNRLGEAAPSSPLGTGHGLIGIAERARLLGGRAASGPTTDGRFEVEVELPWRPTN